MMTIARVNQKSEMIDALLSLRRANCTLLKAGCPLKVIARMDALVNGAYVGGKFGVF
jgi:hypothetical protein